jgi:pilus assembly protein FimV
MQRFTPTHLLRSLACAALLAPVGTIANAAELGDVSARSYIGQPLSADIELVALAPDEVSALQVRLARPDVFRGANITMNPALSSVRMSVVKRDQKQFLHVTTTRAIDADYVHMYVELSAAGRQDVRLATVWLQADPNPPPPPAPVTASVAAPSAMTSGDAERIAAQARAERVAASPAVPAAPPVRDRSHPAPLPSLHESETGAPGVLKAAAAAATPVRQTPTVAIRDLPSRIAEAMGTPRSASAAAPAPASTSAPASSPASTKPAAKRDAAAADSAVPLPVAQALLPLGPLPLPAGVKRPAAPAACAPSGISAKECKVLDTHSQALSSKLVELEGKMKALQGALKNSAATPAATPAVAPTVAAPAATSKVGQAATAVLAAAGSSVAAAVAAPAPAKEAPKSAAVASAAPGAGPGPEAASIKAGEGKPGKSSKPGKAGEAQAATMDGASASASAGAASASASASAGEHGANASASAAGASASASAPVPLKRVLPKLKYKKEKPVERPTNYVAWGAGAVGALLLAGAGLIYWRRKKSGAAPLKIWQGFRKKKPADAAGKPQEAQPLHEVTPESIMQ